MSLQISGFSIQREMQDSDSVSISKHPIFISQFMCKSPRLVMWMQVISFYLLHSGFMIGTPGRISKAGLNGMENAELISRGRACQSSPVSVTGVWNHPLLKRLLASDWQKVSKEPPRSCGIRLIVRVKFAPLYWMIEPKNSSHNVVAIKDTELAMLIVSLSEIGSGNRQVYSKAVERLEEWVTLKSQRKGTEQALLVFLMSIRDWGPLGMEPLYGGLKEVMERLPLPDKERVLFDFYADNWGVRNNWNGRLLTVKTLQALSTEKALFTLTAISKYMKNQAVSPEELVVIQAAVDAIGKKLRKL